MRVPSRNLVVAGVIMGVPVLATLPRGLRAAQVLQVLVAVACVALAFVLRRRGVRAIEFDPLGPAVVLAAVGTLLAGASLVAARESRTELVVAALWLAAALTAAAIGLRARIRMRAGRAPDPDSSAR